MTDTGDTFDKFRTSVDPFIKPREHVNYIRRILALHLQSSNAGLSKQPVALVNSSHEITVGQEWKGIQRQFLEAVKANTDARRKYDEIAQENSTHQASSEPPPPSNDNLVEERIGLLKLQTKYKRLSVVEKHLDLLVEKPAALQGFLDPEEIFHETQSLPNVPKDIVNSLVAQQSAGKPDLKSQLSQLEKIVLRTKLLLRREEQLLQETRSRAKNIPDVISNGTRLEALNATRNELINWIETELSKASGEEEEEDDGSRGPDGSIVDKATINGQLETIKDKYARYLEARKTLLSTITERSDLSLPPVLKPIDANDQVEDPGLAPSSYLLTPFIENLLSVSRKQRDKITQKSHMNSVLTKQTKSDFQTLDAIAEESQLLPAHPMPKSSRRRSVLGEVLTGPSSQSSGLKGKVQPWVYAADCAKIATLEKVAEKVEGGQVAIESSMKARQEIDHLLGQDEVDQVEDEKEQATEDDFWLDSGSKHPMSARKHTETKKKATRPKDAFSRIHGDLGLLVRED